jgi:hypothetical protein
MRRGLYLLSCRPRHPPALQPAALWIAIPSAVQFFSVTLGSYESSMYTATIFSWVLAAAPGTSTPIDKSQPREIERVDLERSDDTVQITARYSDGEVSAEVFLWRDGDGNARLDATWPDGLYMSVISDGEDATVDTDDADEVGRRIERLDLAIQKTAAGKSWFACGFHVLATAAACGAPIPVVGIPICAGEAYLLACECLPLIDKKWEGHECPGF